MLNIDHLDKLFNKTFAPVVKYVKIMISYVYVWSIITFRAIDPLPKDTAALIATTMKDAQQPVSHGIDEIKESDEANKKNKKWGNFILFGRSMLI